MEIVLDIETRSAANLRTHGVHAYFACPHAQIIVERTSFGGRLQDALDFYPDAQIVAHNAEFERAAYAALLPQLWARLKLRTWVCTSALARRLALPGGLGDLCKALGTAQKESAAGSKLIKLFCLPDKSGAFANALTHPVQFREFESYCAQDVTATAQAYTAMRAMISDAQMDVAIREMQAHFWVQESGCPVDTAYILAAKARSDSLREVSQKAVNKLSGLNPAQNVALCKFLNVPSISAANVSAMLADIDTPDAVIELLLARADSANSSPKKLDAMLNRSVRGVLKGWCALYGASRTGRFAGRGAQPQNLPRGDKGAEVIEVANDFANASMHDIVKSLRSCFIPASGKLFYACDYSNVESRILAWLAKEDWKLTIFANSDLGGPDLYSVSAPAFGGDRQAAKVAELACGFGGGVNAFALFAAAYNLKFNEARKQEIVDAWREKNSRIRMLWSRFEHAFRLAILGKAARCEGVDFRRTNNRVIITLPSGRELSYWGARVVGGRIIYQNHQRKGALTDTYGGRITENIVQAISADLILHALNLARTENLRVYLHTHDEVVSDDPGIEKIMLSLPEWLGSCPIGAKTHTLKRYAKT